MTVHENIHYSGSHVHQLPRTQKGLVLQIRQLTLLEYTYWSTKIKFNSEYSEKHGYSVKCVDLDYNL